MPTPEELARASAEQATEAAESLLLVRVTSSRKLVMAQPHAAWSLAQGANHFEGELPEEVAAAYHELVENGLITVELIDAKGNAEPLDLKPKPS
jgi:hypothetical protein